MKDSEKIFQELKKDLKTYAELKFELLKLNTYERTGKVLSVLSYGIIVLFLAFFTILFIFLARQFAPLPLLPRVGDACAGVRHEVRAHGFPKQLRGAGAHLAALDTV